MEPTQIDEELSLIERLPLEERAAALEALEQRLRVSLDDAQGS